MLARTRAVGLTRPGALAAGLGEDFTLTTTDVPGKPEAAESGRDLPPEIMRQICDQLDQLRSASMRTAIELTIDTGRRPEEICDLAFDCLAREADGLPVLVFDNHTPCADAGRVRPGRPGPGAAGSPPHVEMARPVPSRSGLTSNELVGAWRCAAVECGRPAETEVRLVTGQDRRPRCI